MPGYQTPVRTPACLFENSRFIDLGLLLKFTLESVMMDSATVDRGDWEFFWGPISCHRWMMSPMTVLLCINRAGTGLTCMLSRLLNILRERGTSGASVVYTGSRASQN